MFHNQEWKKKAACRGMDTRMFFDYFEASNQVQLEVDAICASCPVQDACETYAINTRSEGGVFGRKFFKSKEKVDA